MSLLSLQFYTRKECTLCDSALAVVKRVQQRIPFRLESIDIDADPVLRERYGSVIPVVAYKNLELARSFVDEKTLASALHQLAQNA